MLFQYNPVRLSFISEHELRYFWMKSESWIILVHRLLEGLKLAGLEKLLKTSLK